MIMYSTILILIIAIAAMGYCLRHSQANTEYLRRCVQERNAQFDGLVEELEESRRKDAELIKELTWERDAAHFMLETVIGDLPEDHQVTMVRRPWMKKTVPQNKLHLAPTGSNIPKQRESIESSRKAYFKDASN